ncbi:uncharacterized protein LOC132870238 [Neoarius graeffei]|uniref:uncharacterized protein LOC132870238 n=1 Tax=Neoarius graeffei TaxID=443677 RepID=UPI00298C41D8|nr:uncharacterized protein LOC132870238 [Neoarius graeffei]
MDAHALEDVDILGTSAAAADTLLASLAHPATQHSRLSSPIKDPLCSPHNGEGARKGALKIACLSNLAGIPHPVGSPHSGRKQKTNIGAWNVRTLMDRAPNDRPERRSAIIARELKRVNIDIAALSETRLADEGQLKEEKGGYTLFWKRKPADEARIHRVGFAIKNRLISQLTESPVGINERLMTLRLRLSNNQMTTAVSAYAPTLDSQDEDKEAFYASLDQVLSNILKEDKILLLRDFNARVGKDHKLWKGTLGKEGVGNTNSNGTLLLSKCAERELVVTNTLFCQRNRFKTSWMHPRSKCWHLIDYVIVRARDRKDVNITRAMTCANDCWTDHHLIHSTMNIQLHQKRRTQRKQTRSKFNIDSLGDTERVQQLQKTLLERLPEEYPEDVEEHWKTLKTILLETCMDTLGYKTRKHQDWFDNNDTKIEQLIDAKRKAFCSWQNDINCKAKRQAHSKAKVLVQRRVRELKNQWWTEKALEIQRLADSGDTRGFFNATKAVYSPSYRGLNPLRSKDGEVLGAIRRLSNNKASGPDGIPAQILKQGGPKLLSHNHSLLSKIWEEEKIPAELRDALIVTIFKKGDKADCGNYRGISLLSTTGKVLARILANRLLPLSEVILPESQCGFRPARGTSDMIFTARQLQEKCREQHLPLYMAFIDLTKAFDSMNRPALWCILSKIGCREKYLKILRLLHDDMTATIVGNGGCETAPFKVHTGVKQGCIIAPTLFSIFIATILHLTSQNLPEGLKFIYRTDSGLFNINMFRAKSKVLTSSIMELQYADDNALVALSEADLQSIMDAFARAYQLLGLDINIRKTQILYQPAPDTPSKAPAIHVDNNTLENVDRFMYLGSLLSTRADIDAEIHHRIGCASAAFARLRDRVFDNREILTKTELLVYQAVILPTLLYGADSWTTYSRHLKALEQYHQLCLRKILRISWEDRRTNISVLKEANIARITSTIARHQLQWTGHVVRMPNYRLPKQILYGQLKEGKCTQGGQKKRYKDMIKVHLRKCHFNLNNWEEAALKRDEWRRMVHEGTAHLEEDLHRAAETKRQLRKERTTTKTAPQTQTTTSRTTIYICPHCNRDCGSRIGLNRHLTTHK